jgi:hypothetical protein
LDRALFEGGLLVSYSDVFLISTQKIDFGIPNKSIFNVALFEGGSSTVILIYSFRSSCFLLSPSFLPFFSIFFSLPSFLLSVIFIAFLPSFLHDRCQQ